MARRVETCEETVVKDGQRQACGRPLVEHGYCDRPSDHVEGDEDGWLPCGVVSREEPGPQPSTPKPTVTGGA